MTTRRVTLRDVALDVGVTVATASMALRANPRISQQTTARVQEAALRLGYIYNRAAANLRQTSSSLVAVCLSDLSNPVFNEFLIHIEEELRAQDRLVFLGIAREDLALQHQFLQTALEQGASGLLLLPVRGTTRTDLTVIWPEGRSRPLLPTALISRALEDVPVSQFLNDDFVAGQMAAQCLIDHGHKRIIWVGGGQETSTARNRQAGATMAMAKAGLPSLELMHGPTLRQFGRHAAEHILGRPATPERPTAAICFSDLIAFGMVSGILQSGTTPAESLSVIGCDDMEEAGLLYPALTTIAVDKAGIGQLAVQSLLRSEHQAKKVLLPPQLVLRATVGPCKGA
ncbi:LacI family DNA-binding transcriptional regulator [Roseinatronobacter alkalisoli]|uniref:LacI family DNA-binding transcriptional regulator n=1 Tax=Roseinatronobacter alkalisoli TaxID=3028235 RepID=A0ABT5TC48_9RHOB|nr:LacI family DNA-binding transcriptional regulator [Roseinatronobacter sp. HJB301]MDD7972698.1 LacI family DNA-binding transcriptional regulator [Roseinatronobacter sp. HJB301]